MSVDELQRAAERDHRLRAALDAFAREVAPDGRAIVLGRYHVDNLIALLHCIYVGDDPSYPFVLADGDWAGELYWMLDPSGYDPARHRPNATPAERVARLRAWWRGGRPWSEVLGANLATAGALCRAHELGVECGMEAVYDPYGDGRRPWEPGCGRSAP